MCSSEFEFQLSGSFLCFKYYVSLQKSRPGYEGSIFFLQNCVEGNVHLLLDKKLVPLKGRDVHFNGVLLLCWGVTLASSDSLVTHNERRQNLNFQNKHTPKSVLKKNRPISLSSWFYKWELIGWLRNVNAVQTSEWAFQAEIFTSDKHHNMQCPAAIWRRAAEEKGTQVSVIKSLNSLLCWRGHNRCGHFEERKCPEANQSSKNYGTTLIQMPLNHNESSRTIGPQWPPD